MMIDIFVKIKYTKLNTILIIKQSYGNKKLQI